MMHTKTLAQLSADLAQKKMSSVELTQYYLNRIQQYDEQLNSFITITPELALKSATQADKNIAQGKQTALTGIPMAHKDIFCTDGVKTTCASKMLAQFEAPYNATAVNKLAEAGMVMVGKTNMDEFAMGSSNESSFFGACRNPWDTNYVPGGSSGGSAAAVAARIIPMTTGTDTGGSIRQPASLCGISGLKPTYGRVSRWGMIAFASSMDQGGVFAQTAEDIALVMNAMSGFDEKDSTSAEVAVPDFTATLNQSLAGLKIGLPKEYFTGLDPKVEQLTQEAIKQYEKLGVSIHEISLPNVNLSIPVYYVLAPAECSANLARYDGVRYGFRCEHPQDLLDLYERTRSEAFGAEVKRRILVGTYVLSSGHYDDYFIKAQQVRGLIANDFSQAFKQVDMILSPATPGPAFKLGEKAQDPSSMYLADIYTVAANLVGIPGISIPMGFVNGLPIGLQLLAKNFDEARLLNAAHQFQLNTEWHQKAPAQFVEGS